MDLSRRQFVKLSLLGVTGWFLSLNWWLRRPVAPVRRPDEGYGYCTACGARLYQYHVFGDGPVPGAYCPNCGRALEGLRYNLGLRPGYVYRRIRRSRKKKNMEWDYEPVPFPDGELVARTDKPVVVASQLTI